MNDQRKHELERKVTEIIAQEARHLADCADYDQIAKTDEEDAFIRAELHRQADVISATPRTFWQSVSELAAMRRKRT